MTLAPLPTDIDTEHFRAWTNYWGELARVTDDVGGRPCHTVVYGFENASAINEAREEGAVPPGGAVYGYVATGDAYISDRMVTWRMRDGQWFAMPDGCKIRLFPDRPSRVVVVQRVDFFGLRSMGGPIEEMGRLRYIDGCSDTLLMGPPIAGDPCLNHLHFPPGIDQTMHTHPTVRAGIVGRGEGWCATPAGSSRLTTGVLFSIPAGGAHNFLTDEGQEMDVIAYHPDSDWGPTHDDHPMINRTLVDGTKIDNTTGEHVDAEFIMGDRRP